jgi:ankyrin repeat protein
MAPEFIPFIVCGGLILASLLGCLVSGVLMVSGRLRRRTWPLPLLTLLPTLGLMLATAVCGKGIHQAFFLNEPMGIAACQGNIDEVRRLLDRGASPDSCDVDCRHPALVCAARAGHADIVELLLKHGADPDALDSQGASALQRARQGQHEVVVHMLEGVGHKGATQR